MKYIRNFETTASAIAASDLLSPNVTFISEWGANC